MLDRFKISSTEDRMAAAAGGGGGVRPVLVDKLEQHGVSTIDVKELQKAGFYTVESVVYAPKKKLTEIKEVIKQKADKIQLEETR